MQSKLNRFFFVSAGILMLITSTAKLVSGFGAMHVLEVNDPILRISFRHVFWIIGSLELFIALACFFVGQTWFQAVMVAFLATNFILYRIGLVWIGWHKPCSCMGNLTDVLHISP